MKDEKVTISSYKLTSKGIRKTTKKVAYEKTFLAKTKEWESEKKTEKFERLQAVSRHPDYMKEYKRFKELDGTYPEIELREYYIEKYKMKQKKNVNILGKDYQKFVTYLKKNAEYQKKLLAIREKVEKDRLKIITHEVTMIQKWKVEEPPCLWFPDYIIEPQIQYPDKPKPAAVELKYKLVENMDPLENGYLYLQIDLSKERGLINKEIKKIIRKYHKITKDIEFQDLMDGRPIKPWEVYDMKHRHNMKLIDIARELSGEPKTTKSDAIYSTIRRAHDKAKSAIDNVI